MSIAGIVLAAGLSERMEGDIPKQLLPLGATTLLGRVVQVAGATSLDPLVVVTGHRADEVEAGIDPGRASFVRNPDYAAGNLTSLRAGLAAVRGVDAAMLLLADNPEIESAIIEELATVWLEFRPFAAVVSYRGEVGHPFVLSAEAIRQVRSLGGTKPLWHWLQDDHADELLTLTLDRPKPRDVNTAEEYRLLVEEEPAGS